MPSILVPIYVVRGLFPLEQTPGVISLLAGKPNDAMFPFTSVQFTVSRPDNSEQMLLKVDDDLLSMGLQYAPTSGIPPMIEWLTEFQGQEHGRRRQEGWRISVTAGSQDAIYKVRPAITRHLSLIHRYPGHTSARGPGRSYLHREARLCVRRAEPRWSFIV
jgi:DNA-binding transcriptional MocR family regulator